MILGFVGGGVIVGGFGDIFLCVWAKVLYFFKVFTRGSPIASHQPGGGSGSGKPKGP